MPSHKQHRAVDKLLFGREFPDVHSLMDITAGVEGPKHRNSLAHNPLFILAITRDPEKFASALIHDMLDRLYSRKKIYRQSRKLKRK